MISHICCMCIFQLFHLFQTYVAFKCFMLHVFLAVWRVRGHGGVMVAGHGCRRMGRGEPMTGGCGAWHAGGWRSGARRGEVRLRGGANGWGREIKVDGRIASESRTNTRRRRCTCGHGELVDGVQVVHAQAGNNRLKESYPSSMFL